MQSTFFLLLSFVVAVAGVMSFSLFDWAKNASQIIRHASAASNSHHLAEGGGYYHLQSYSGDGCTGTIDTYAIMIVDICISIGGSYYFQLNNNAGSFEFVLYSDSACSIIYAGPIIAGGIDSCVDKSKGVFLSAAYAPPVISIPYGVRERYAILNIYSMYFDVFT